jgi:hypothetical protein
MAASLKDKRTPITTPPYQVPNIDVTPDPPIFSLVTTFNNSLKIIHLIQGDFEEKKISIPGTIHFCPYTVFKFYPATQSLESGFTFFTLLLIISEKVV